MRILTWNCNGRFRDKYNLLGRYGADLLVIQECENPADARHQVYQKWAKDAHWIGGVAHKGLAVFSRTFGQGRVMDVPARGLELFLPLEFDNGLQILAVWTKATDRYATSYVFQLWSYLDQNLGYFDPKRLIIAGDLNSNAIWDLKRKQGHHQDVLDLLSPLGLQSAYHVARDQEHGKERTPSFYLHKNRKKPYHLDYVFAPNSFCKNAHVSIGRPAAWLAHSDHMPVVCQFETGMTLPTTQGQGQGREV